MLALIYRDYICTPERRNKLLEIDQEELKRQEEVLQEKYEIHFKDRKQRIKENNIEENTKKENVYMTDIKEEKWYKKIINKILSFFKIR